MNRSLGRKHLEPTWRKYTQRRKRGSQCRNVKIQANKRQKSNGQCGNIQRGPSSRTGLARETERDENVERGQTNKKANLDEGKMFESSNKGKEEKNQKKGRGKPKERRIQVVAVGYGSAGIQVIESGAGNSPSLRVGGGKLLCSI